MTAADRRYRSLLKVKYTRLGKLVVRRSRVVKRLEEVKEQLASLEEIVRKLRAGESIT